MYDTACDALRRSTRTRRTSTTTRTTTTRTTTMTTTMRRRSRDDAGHKDGGCRHRARRCKSQSRSSSTGRRAVLRLPWHKRCRVVVVLAQVCTASRPTRRTRASARRSSRRDAGGRDVYYSVCHALRRSTRTRRTSTTTRPTTTTMRRRRPRDDDDHEHGGFRHRTRRCRSTSRGSSTVQRAARTSFMSGCTHYPRARAALGRADVACNVACGMSRA